MGKGKPAKSKPPTAQKGGASSSVLKHAPLLLLAVAVQLLLTWGYFQWQADPQAPPSGDAPPQASASAPTRCPDDWSDCPAVPGADWAALAALEAEAEAPTEEQLASCDAEDILSSQRVPGMHLLCVVPSASGGMLGVAVYRDMLKGHPAQLLLLPPTLAAAEHLVAAIEHKLQVPARQNPLSQPGALFTDAGIRMKRTRKLTGMRRAIMTEGGQWLWPPGEVGHVHPLPGLVAPGIETRVVTLSIRPLVVEIENFLTTEEAAHIVARAKPVSRGSTHLKPSPTTICASVASSAARHSRVCFLRMPRAAHGEERRGAQGRRRGQGRQGVPHQLAVLSADDQRRRARAGRRARPAPDETADLARRVHPGGSAPPAPSHTRMWHVGPPYPISCPRISHLLHPLSPSPNLPQPPTAATRRCSSTSTWSITRRTTTSSTRASTRPTRRCFHPPHAPL